MSKRSVDDDAPDNAALALARFGPGNKKAKMARANAMGGAKIEGIVVASRVEAKGGGDPQGGGVKHRITLVVRSASWGSSPTAMIPSNANLAHAYIQSNFTQVPKTGPYIPGTTNYARYDRIIEPDLKLAPIGPYLSFTYNTTASATLPAVGCVGHVDILEGRKAADTKKVDGQDVPNKNAGSVFFNARGLQVVGTAASPLEQCAVACDLAMFSAPLQATIALTLANSLGGVGSFAEINGGEAGKATAAFFDAENAKLRESLASRIGECADRIGDNEPDMDLKKATYKDLAGRLRSEGSTSLPLGKNYLDKQLIVLQNLPSHPNGSDLEPMSTPMFISAMMDPDPEMRKMCPSMFAATALDEVIVAENSTTLRFSATFVGDKEAVYNSVMNNGDPSGMVKTNDEDDATLSQWAINIKSPEFAHQFAIHSKTQLRLVEGMLPLCPMLITANPTMRTAGRDISAVKDPLTDTYTDSVTHNVPLWVKNVGIPVSREWVEGILNDGEGGLRIIKTGSADLFPTPTPDKAPPPVTYDTHGFANLCDQSYNLSVDIEGEKALERLGADKDNQLEVKYYVMWPPRVMTPDVYDEALERHGGSTEALLDEAIANDKVPYKTHWFLGTDSKGEGAKAIVYAVAQNVQPPESDAE